MSPSGIESLAIILFAYGCSGVVLEANTHKCFLVIVISSSGCSIDKAFEIKYTELYLNVICTIIPEHLILTGY